MKNKSHPSEFVKSVKSGDHLLLLNEDDSKATQLRLDFIKRGLDNNEHCIYITAQHDALMFEGKLKEMHVNVEKYKNSGKLEIISILDPFVHEDGFTNYVGKLWNSLTIDEIQNTRIACNIIKDITKITHEQLLEFLKAEKWLQDDFMKPNFAILCSCDISNVNSDTGSTFLKNLHNHNCAIFAPQNEIGSGLYLR